MLKFVTDREIYKTVIRGLVPETKGFLWLATADIKDLYVEKGSRMVPFLEILSDLVSRKVEVRLLHAKEPGPAFRRDFDRYPNLAGGVEMMLCPRVHLKSIIVDGRCAYAGSANLTGAGVGAKNKDKRNFEAGIITDEIEIVRRIVEQYDAIWRGSHCRACMRKQFCADHRHILAER